MFSLAAYHVRVWWLSIRGRIDAIMQQHRMRRLDQLMNQVDLDEFEALQAAAAHAHDILLLTGMATGNERADEALAWEIGRRLRRLHTEWERKAERT